MQAVREARPDDEVTAAVAANNSVAERAADADEAAPRKFFAELGKRMEPLLDRVQTLLIPQSQALNPLLSPAGAFSTRWNNVQSSS